MKASNACPDLSFSSLFPLFFLLLLLSFSLLSSPQVSDATKLRPKAEYCFGEYTMSLLCTGCEKGVHHEPVLLWG